MESTQRSFYDPIKELLIGDNCWEGKTSTQLTWKVFNGNSEEVLAKLSDNTIDCVITSPPYYWLRDYGVDNQIGQEGTVTEYVEAISSVMDEIYRILKPTGLLFLNLGDTYYSGKGESQGKDKKSSKRRFGLRAVDKSGGVGVGVQRKSMIGIPWRIAVEMAKRKWILRSAIIWHRSKALPEFVKDRPKRSYEHVFMFAKDRHYFFNAEPLIKQKYDEDVWTILARPKTNSIETAPFPDELVQRCLDIGCPQGGVVLDPFAGSGTTLRVALNNGNPSIGIDLNRKFCEHTVNELTLI